ncbi:MAG: DUF1614 domain-containing protein [Clostridia bacterium]|nr:DUF1614 domain-containing protein [Clostridia bacterium]
MSIGLVLLSVVSVLILFGVAQRVLDKMQLTDRAALLIAAAIFFGGLLPNIEIGRVSLNVGGALVPLGVCIYMLLKTDTAREFWRALAGSVITAALVFFLGRLLPDEPEKIWIDPNYVYGIAGGIVAYILGRSRRAAFICGVLGVLLADIAVGVMNWVKGIDQQLMLGGAGALDVVVLSGLIGVLLSELVGEVIERIARRDEQSRREQYESRSRRREKAK